MKKSEFNTQIRENLARQMVDLNKGRIKDFISENEALKNLDIQQGTILKPQFIHKKFNEFVYG